VWAFIDELRVHTAAAKPNAAHQILAQWEQEGRFDRFMIATQNIDGLHQKAGSQRVSELHGSIWQMAEPRSGDYAEDEGFSDDMQDFLSGDNREALLRKWSVENQCEVWTNLDVPFKQIPPHADTNIRPTSCYTTSPMGTGCCGSSPSSPGSRTRCWSSVAPVVL